MNSGNSEIQFHAFVDNLTEVQRLRWDNFIARHPLGSIHQTYQFGEFQKKIDGRGPVIRFAALVGDEIIGACQCVRMDTGKFGMGWWYSARGPVIDENSSHVNEFLEYISSELKKIGGMFWRMDPYFENPVIVRHKPITKQYQPTDTLMLDLTKTEEELLAEMKRKGRYNITLAQKKGVMVERIRGDKTTKKQRDVFLKLQNETTARDGFLSHTDDYYHDFITGISPNTYLFYASYNNYTISSAVLTVYGNKAIYYFGASTSDKEYRNIMAPYLLQWEMIRFSKKMGCMTYDFLGISPEQNAPHKFDGITQFKLKFGGQRKTYHAGAEIVLNKWQYTAYRLIKKVL